MALTKWKLDIGKAKLYALKYKQDNVIRNFYDRVKAAKQFHTKLYDTHSSHITPTKKFVQVRSFTR